MIVRVDGMMGMNIRVKNRKFSFEMESASTIITIM
jgi:hypothetical protein